MTELWDLAASARDQLASDIPVLWRRDEFNPAGNYTGSPKWHRLVKVERADPPNQWHYRWTAVCGYSYIFNGLLGQRPSVRGEVKTAKLRCSKCDAGFRAAGGAA